MATSNFGKHLKVRISYIITDMNLIIYKRQLMKLFFNKISMYSRQLYNKKGQGLMVAGKLSQYKYNVQTQTKCNFNMKCEGGGHGGSQYEYYAYSCHSLMILSHEIRGKGGGGWGSQYEYDAYSCHSLMILSHEIRGKRGGGHGDHNMNTMPIVVIVL